MAKTIRRTQNVKLKKSQITRNSISNDVWMSPAFSELITLETGDTFALDVIFKDNETVEMVDNGISDNESIKISVDGEGGVGGAPDNQADYSFYFTHVEGDLLTGTERDPITGTENITATNGNFEVDRSIELFTTKAVTFGDIHVELTNQDPNNWSFDKVSVGVDADNVNIK